MKVGHKIEKGINFLVLNIQNRITIEGGRSSYPYVYLFMVKDSINSIPFAIYSNNWENQGFC